MGSLGVTNKRTRRVWLALMLAWLAVFAQFSPLFGVSQGAGALAVAALSSADHCTAMVADHQEDSRSAPAGDCSYCCWWFCHHAGDVAVLAELPKLPTPGAGLFLILLPALCGAMGRRLFHLRQARAPPVFCLGS